MFGSKVLDSKIMPDYIGRHVKIIYKGMIQGKKYAYKSFDVSLKEEDGE